MKAAANFTLLAVMLLNLRRRNWGVPGLTGWMP